MAEVVEGGERVGPGLVGRPRVARREQASAQVFERLRLQVPLACRLVRPHRPLVAADGVGVVAEVLVRVAESVPGARLIRGDAELLAQRDGLLSEFDRLLVLSISGMRPADAVEGLGFPAPAAGLPEQVESESVVVQRLLVPAQADVQGAEAEVHPRQPDGVVQRGVEFERVTQMRQGVVVVPGAVLDPGEAPAPLTLRLLGGLSTEDVARAFLVAEPAMAQRLVRAKRKIKLARIPYRVPRDEELPERLRTVLAVIYLVYNAGVDSVAAGDGLRAEAIRLARIRDSLMRDEPEATGACRPG